MAENEVKDARVEETQKENKMNRFLVTIGWLILALGVDAIALFTKGYIIGLVLELVFFIVTFSVPYLRKKGTYTRYWGWLALASAIWFAFLMFSAGGGE